ncbi:MAG: adenylyl-sulfate kinase [Bradymonadaceae bacterium]
MSDEIYWHSGDVTKADREQVTGHRGACLWLTGLSGSGKSSVAAELERQLTDDGIHTFWLDGDNIRHGLNKDLGFSPEDRDENIRRIGEVAKLFVESGTIAIASFISPYRETRAEIRSLMAEGDFIEVFVQCPLEVCEERDPKGIYEKARSGEIENFTGISAPYEEPQNPEIVVDTTSDPSPKASAGKLYTYLADHGYLRSD